MISNEIISWLQEYGYFSFFILGFIGTTFTPIPDPVLLCTAGFFSDTSHLNPILSFFLTYTGLMLSLYTKYLIGRFFSKRAVLYLSKKKKYQKHILKTEALIERFGYISIIISYFLPIIRHLLPLILGISHYSHRKYVAITFLFGFCWCLGIFCLGFLFFQN